MLRICIKIPLVKHFTKQFTTLQSSDHFHMDSRKKQLNNYQQPLYLTSSSLPFLYTHKRQISNTKPNHYSEWFSLLTTFTNRQWRCSIKKGVLKDSAKFKGKYLSQRLFLIMLQAYIFHCFYSSFHTFTRKTSWKNDKQKCLKYSWILVVQTLTQVFSCDFCDIFKNTILTEDLLVIASEPSYPPLFLILLPAL